MRVGMDEGRIVAWDDAEGEWVHIGAPWDEDITAFLAGGSGAVSDARRVMADPDRSVGATPAGLPMVPQSLRAFALWERHMINGAHGMLDRFGSVLQKRLVGAYEALTRRTFPALALPANYYRFPQYYMSNHRTVRADGARISWPAHATVVDFELEIGIVISREVRNVTGEAAAAAIGGFTVFNDLSLRDVQWDDTRKGTFGGVVKAKTWAGAMGATITTADEILPVWDTLTGSVRVNGDLWTRGTTAGSRWSPVDAVGYASRDETLYPGDVLSSGTLPGCCGLEMRRFPRPGDCIDLQIDRIGTLRTELGKAAVNR